MSGFARLVLRLANWIAGADREEWVLAMAAETDAAGGHGALWALGCLYAAARDRLERDWGFIAALFALPALALVLSLAMCVAAFVGVRAAGIPDLAAIPVMFAGDLVAAWLLGRMRPAYSPIAVGTFAFIVHLAMPMTLMWVAFGKLMPLGSPNMTYYNMPSPIGLVVSWLIWVAATRWGGATKRTAAA
jgi:hypothetical protein